METDKFIHKNIKDYILYVSDVKNLSKNTSLSYERDLKKFAAFINSLNISQYNQIFFSYLLIKMNYYYELKKF